MLSIFFRFRLRLSYETTIRVMFFGQLVIGPPGAGKSTYCAAVSDVLRKLKRDVVLVNLDFANEEPPYEPNIDVGNLITVEDSMKHLHLGPNGSMLYCVQFLKTNIEWLFTEMEKCPKHSYFIFDLPGQVELYTHDDSVQFIVEKLTEKFDLRLVCLNLIDSHYCSEPAKFISACMTCLSSMLRLALPHINVLSKIDLIEVNGRPDLGLNYYLETLNMEYISDQLTEDPFFAKYKKLNSALCSLIDDFSLVNFVPLCVTDKNLMVKLVKLCDKANGFIFGQNDSESEETKKLKMFSSVFRESDFQFESGPALEEMYMTQTSAPDDS
ncbi:GPN-loop GTPase 2-like [Convolutriloba macropyga]|uniref:GPN-loop GTPase 2-like n=1 Tax=Convolutriloba macropyga TaxID=536237 RepID=UPI003F51F788